MPGVIGCIDCTHVAIFPPPINHPNFPENIFINRKNYHSINVQLICDVDLYIYHVNARFPGGCHDSHIWNTSNVQQILRNIYNRVGEGYFLLGDSGYGLRPWLLTPLENPHGEQEERYNIIHKCARATIERVNGILKMRFRCLLKHRLLHYSPTMASKIIHACVVLHNICILNNIGIEEDDEDFDFGLINEPLNEINNANARVNPELAAGRRVQRRIINQLQV